MRLAKLILIGCVCLLAIVGCQKQSDSASDKTWSSLGGAITGENWREKVGFERLVVIVAGMLGEWSEENMQLEGTPIDPDGDAEAFAILVTTLFEEPDHRSKNLNEVMDMIKSRLNGSHPSTQPQQSEIRTEEPSMTAEWQTYENIRFGFSVQYPSHWKITTEAANGDGVIISGGDSVEMVFSASNYFEEFAPDLTDYESFTLSNGEQANYKMENRHGSVTVSLIAIQDNLVQYSITGVMTEDYYTQNSNLIESIFKSYRYA